MNRKIFLFTAILIPFVMLAIVAIDIYLNQSHLEPQYDFVFMSSNKNSYICEMQQRAKIFPNYFKLDPNPVGNKTCTNIQFNLYRYDIKTHQSQLLSPSTAQTYELSTPPVQYSPDNFSVTFHCHINSEFNWWGIQNISDQSVCLTTNDGSTKTFMDLNLSNDSKMHYSFIGWILSDKPRV